MDRNDQQAIGNLFKKLANVERQTPPRDAEAERFINDQIARQPGAHTTWHRPSSCKSRP